MAEITKLAGTVHQRISRSNSNAHISDIGNVSSDIVEAMDRIFPKSPSKFLQNPFPEHFGLNGKQFSKNASSLSSNVYPKSTLSCTVSNAHIMTDTTTTATAVFTDLSTSASGSKSPIMSSVPALCNDMPSLPAPAVVANDLSEQNKNNSLTNKKLSKSKATKADMEICSQNIVDSPRQGVLEKICNDSPNVCSETDSAVFMEKKRKKKRKKEAQSSEKEVEDRVSKENANLTGTKALEENYHEKVINRPVPYLKNGAPAINSIADCTNGYSPGSDHAAIDPVRNGQLSSCYDNLFYPPSVQVKQKLPKVRRHFIHISKDSKYLMKKLLPCFVVVKKVDELCETLADKNLTFDQSFLDMSLSDRIKHLADKCEKNEFECHKKQKEFRYKNIFDDSLIEFNSEEEFVNQRGRSLRKRNHKVCYVEPSEDDLLDDFTSSSKKAKSQSPEILSNPDVVEKKKKKSSVDKKDTNAYLSENIQNKVAKSLTNDKSAGKKSIDKGLKQKRLEKDNQNSSEQSNPVESSVPNYARVANQDLQKNVVKEISKENPVVSTSASLSSFTYTSKASLTDNEGRSLVYVFPKNNVINTSKNVESSDASKSTKGKRPGPASKTTPVSLSVAPVTTLSLPRSLLGSSGSLLPPSLSQTIQPVVQPSVTGSSSSPQFYMVKIDGKDFLVPVLTGSSQPRLANPTAGTLPSNYQPGGPCRLIYQPVSGLSSGIQAGLTRTSAPTLAPPLVGTRFSTIMVPGAPISSAVRMISTSLSTNSVLSSLPLIGNPQVATCIPATSLSSVSQAARAPQLVPKSIVTTAISLPHGSSSLVSLVRPSVPVINLTSTSQNIVVASTSATSKALTTSTVAPLAAPASTTVLRSSRPRVVSTTTTAAAFSVSTTNTATGARCFRIIVPACTATGTPARIATLGTPVNSSPLTHMSINSSLLPQRKRSSTDKDISPEKRAAKRRRLEAKYPLPPGVVIKTEPLDSPQSTTTVQAGSVRSLLTQNIQLITASGAGSGSVQNIRIVSPPTGSRQMRLAQNVILRAPNASTVAVSAGSISTMSSVSIGGSNVVIVAPPCQSSVSAVISPTSQASSVSTVSTSTTKSTTTIVNATIFGNASSDTDVSLSSSATAVASMSNGPASNLTSSNTGTHSIVSSASDTVSDKITTLPYTTSTTTSLSASSVGNLVPSFSKDRVTNLSSSNPTPLNSLQSLKESVEALRQLVDKQETMGLKGPRLEKLKEVLEQKENALNELDRQEDAEETSSLAQPDDEVVQGTTISNPVIID